MEANSRSTAGDRGHTNRKVSSRTVRPKDRRTGICRISNDKALEIEVKTYLRVCEGMNTPRSLSCYLLAQAGEWNQLLELSTVQPYLKDFSTFSADYICTEMMKKNPRIPLGINCSEAAIQSFLSSEELCRLTNERFISYREKPTQSSDEQARIVRVSQIIASALGPLSRGKLMRLENSFRYGPGATSSLSGVEVVLSRKYTCQGHVTPRLQPYLMALHSVHKESGITSLRDYSAVVTVPKNARTDRTICIEPHENSRFQLGVGAIIRDRLVKLGLEPNDQNRNREMARTALETGYATIDLKAASDMISSQVVLDLLPIDWFRLLHIGRTDKAMLPDGSIHTLEKFSAMGNGFTWELETLIFYAIARSVTNKPIGVFGDDLVVPMEAVDELFKALNFFGFSVNRAKSFWQDDFRESCGSDFYRGQYVRPFFLRKENEQLYDASSLAIHISNGLRTLAHLLADRRGCDDRLLLAYQYARSKIHKSVKTYNSFGYGDDGLLVNLDECTPSPRGRGFQGYIGRVYYRRPKRSSKTDIFGAYLAALDIGSLTSHQQETARGRLEAPKLRRIPVFDWYHLGTWLNIGSLNLVK